MRALLSPWAAFESREKFSAHCLDPQSWLSSFYGLRAWLWRPGVSAYKKFAGEVLAQAQNGVRQELVISGQKQSQALSSHEKLKNPSDDLTKTFVLACKALQRTLKMTPYASQIVAARIMLDGRVAEVPTGEGKTIAIAIAAAVAALKNIPVHVVTANDYLASRDAREMTPFFSILGLTVGAVTQPMDIADRRKSWGMDITYCSAKELVFDYLREGLSGTTGLSDLERRARRLSGVERGEPPVLRELCMAIVDEIDTVLIDEASVPLVLSRRGADSPEQEFFVQAAAQAALLREGHHFTLGTDKQGPLLTSAGQQQLLAWPLSPHAVYNQIRHREATVILALTAMYKLHRDEDYVVIDGQITIIDETTGRAAKGRAWSRGLHQLVEIKEDVAATVRNDTVSQITYQRFFPRYNHLSGMSGTVRGCAYELAAIYGLSVVVVPPRLPRRCQESKPVVYANSDELWSAVLVSARSARSRQQPVLIGTATVSDSEHLSRLFTAAGLPHAVLNARQDEAESRVIAAAGQQGQVTIATSMAGRGTDIKLGAGVAELGGLHVILCQHNVSARIDRQFLGRAARQGEPGSTEILLSKDFPLLLSWLTSVTNTCPGKYIQGYLQTLATVAQWMASNLSRRRRLRLLRADIETERELLFNREKFS